MIRWIGFEDKAVGARPAALVLQVHAGGHDDGNGLEIGLPANLPEKVKPIGVGQVLPIGGLKEKVLAAHRAGLKTVILPRRNEKDLDDVPEEVRQALTFIYAERVEDVLKAALEPPARARDGGHKNGRSAQRKAKKRTSSSQER